MIWRRNGFAPKVCSEAVDLSSLGPLSGELKQVTKRPVMADSRHGYTSALNWLYVVIHVDDLALGAFEHAVVTGANA
jgi:hypothetical protein